MREIRTSGLMSGEGKRTAMRHRASPRLYRFHFPCLLPALMSCGAPIRAIRAGISSRCRRQARDVWSVRIGIHWRALGVREGGTMI